VAFLFLAERSGNTEALWIELFTYFRTAELSLLQQATIKYLANTLGFPVVFLEQGPTATHRSSVFRPMTEVDVIPDPPGSACASCGKEAVELAPLFTGCRQMSLPREIVNPAGKPLVFRCGQYCWECLRNALSQTTLANIPRFCDRCPACMMVLPIWALQICFRDARFTKR
jgi:hypothetical protein